jgi:hypothetical protein
MKYFAMLAVLVLALACGSKVAPTFEAGGAGGTFSTVAMAGVGGRIFGTGGSGGATGGEAGAADDDELGPSITITSPSSVSDPASGTVLTAPQVTVTCTVTQSSAAGSEAVLASSVKIKMFGADGKQIGADGSVLSTANPNEYGATFVLTGVASGAVTFSCSASDEAATAHTNTATVSTFYDAGPTITLTSPENGSAHSLSAILFNFSALPSPLTTGDQSADVTAVTLTVNAVAIAPLGTVSGMPGYYQTSVDLNDPKQFTPTPVGLVPVTITATNKRGTVATSKFSFIVDSTGPVINIVSPPTTGVQFIGGEVTIEFTAVDETNGSGVDPNTLSVQVNTSPPSLYVEGDSWHAQSDGKTFDYSFNTIEYSSQYQVSVTIVGSDKAGNQSQGASAQYYVDNSPPILDLQPPLIQEEDNGPNYICSAPFDPLGVSPDDLAIVPSVNTLRALAWDLGNVPDGPGVSFFSGIDDAAGVRLYFQADGTAPLLKNKAGTEGGVCDDIADTTLPFATLTPVTPTGRPYFPPNAPVVAGCTDGTDSAPPSTSACGNSSDLIRVIAHDDLQQDVNIPVIYGVQVDSTFCTGGPLALTTKVAQDGWVCAAVVAQDKIGNRSVSAPIRLCLDAADSEGTAYEGSPACATMSTTPPTCVGVAPSNCTPPTHFPATVIKRPLGT